MALDNSKYYLYKKINRQNSYCSSYHFTEFTQIQQERIMNQHKSEKQDAAKP